MMIPTVGTTLPWIRMAQDVRTTALLGTSPLRGTGIPENPILRGTMIVVDTGKPLRLFQSLVLVLARNCFFSPFLTYARFFSFFSSLHLSCVLGRTVLDRR